MNADKNLIYSKVISILLAKKTHNLSLKYIIFSDSKFKHVSPSPLLLTNF